MFVGLNVVCYSIVTYISEGFVVLGFIENDSWEGDSGGMVAPCR